MAKDAFFISTDSTRIHLLGSNVVAYLNFNNRDSDLKKSNCFTTISLFRIEKQIFENDSAK